MREATLRAWIKAWGTRVVVATVLAASASGAGADEFVNRVNSIYGAVSASRRGDTVLLPVLAKLDAPPRPAGTVEEAALLPATASDFGAAAAWAQAPNQQAALKVLADITKETDWSKSYAFAQPYGADTVEPAMVRARMYTELGDPPTLAAAQHLYLPAMDRLGCLVNVEATRLQAAGKPAEALDVLANWVFFGRQMADRAFLKEASWGLRAMAQGFERMRDVCRTDMLGAKGVGTDRIRGLLARLSETGFTDLSRMSYPIGDRTGTEQVVARVYPSGGSVDERVFAPTMAKLGSAEHPLRLFSESSRWRSAAGMQVPANVAQQKMKALYDDWQARWTSDWFDRRQSLVAEWDKLDRPSCAAVAQSTPDMGELADLRQIVRTEAMGTRATLSLLGYFYTQKIQAPQLSAIRPLWMRTLELDPFCPKRVDGPEAWLKYMVPMRDTPKNSRGEPEPYEIDVVTTDPDHPVNIKLTDDTFLLFSLGSNNESESAKRTQNTAKKLDKPADYLLFPPVISLQRERLIAVQHYK